MEYRRLALIFDDEAGQIGELALRLVRLGVDALYANDVEESVLLAHQEEGSVGAVVVPVKRALEWIPVILKRLKLPPGAIVPAGSQPTNAVLESLRAQGLRWALWTPEDDRALRFVVSAAMSETDDDEIRFDLRVPTEIEAMASRGPLQRPCKIRNLSDAGAMVELDPPVSVGGRIELAFSVEDRPLLLPAKVMWSTESRNSRKRDTPAVTSAMGVEFTDIDPDVTAMLQGYLTRERKEFLL